MNVFQILFSLLGRVCLALIFIAAGIYKIFDWDSAMQYTHSILSSWQVYVAAMPFAAKCVETLLAYLPVVLGLATFLEIGGGVLLFLGIKARLGSFLLLLFLIPTTIFAHAFWYLDGAEHNLQQVMFLKNVAIIGGLLLVLAFGSGLSRKEKFEQRD